MDVSDGWAWIIWGFVTLWWEEILGGKWYGHLTWGIEREQCQVKGVSSERYAMSIGE